MDDLKASPTFEFSEIDPQYTDGTGTQIEKCGFLSGIRGEPVSSNPHPEGDWKHEIWCQGWEAGQSPDDACLNKE